MKTDSLAMNRVTAVLSLRCGSPGGSLCRPTSAAAPRTAQTRGPAPRLATPLRRGGGIAAWLAALSLAVAWSASAASEPEQAALRQLQSAASPAQKEAACLALKQVGTAASVPALSALLRDTNLWQWALSTLETLPGTEAGDALLAALPDATGPARCGVAHALGLRRETRAVPALAGLLTGSDPEAARAAAQALGRIGGGEAVTVLRRALDARPPSLRAAAADALLACAESRLATRDPGGAAAIYAALASPDLPAPLRAAAFRGRVLTTGDRAATLVADALRGGDAALAPVAIALVRELPGAEVTATFLPLLGGTLPAAQIALVEALAQRGDPLAAPAIAAWLRDAEGPARGAGLRALGELGDASQVAALAEAAAAGAPPDREAARDALASLRRGEVARAMLAQLESAAPAVQVELAQALARRGERDAVPVLLKLAARSEPRAATAACKALARLAGAADRDALLGCLMRATSDEIRAAAAVAFAAVGQRGGSADTFLAAALEALPGADVAARCGLLQAAGLLGGARALDALRAAARDADARVSGAAIRSLAENAGPEVLPDLLRLARETPTDTGQALALEGYWRLVEGLSDRPVTERTRLVREGLAAARTPAERKAGLGRLAELSGGAALELARQFCADEAVRPEAEFAAGQIATRSLGDPAAGAESALRELAVQAGSERVRADAKAALGYLEEHRDYVRPWVVCGPFRVEGKEAQQLFDVTFAPEQPGAAVDWRPLPLPAAGTNFWQADLAEIVGGNHCVVYLRARLFLPEGQVVRLEMGSDDGIKLWLNGALAHANNAVRGFTPGQDRAGATLRQGWNEMLVKITQHTLGCAVSVRVRAPDGTRLAGLRFGTPGDGD